MGIKSVQLTIIGLVQGVGFRYHARQQAHTLGLTGYIRNLPGGGVECIVEGDEVAVDDFINWCREGTPLSEVESLEVHGQRALQRFERFEIRF